MCVCECVSVCVCGCGCGCVCVSARARVCTQMRECVRTRTHVIACLQSEHVVWPSVCSCHAACHTARSCCIDYVPLCLGHEPTALQVKVLNVWVRAPPKEESGARERREKARATPPEPRPPKYSVRSYHEHEDVHEDEDEDEDEHEHEDEQIQEHDNIQTNANTPVWSGGTSQQGGPGQGAVSGGEIAMPRQPVFTPLGSCRDSDCQGQGGQGGSCYCDKSCHLNQDCCGDYQEWCPRQGSCQAACGDPHQIDCSCEKACVVKMDCCQDYLKVVRFAPFESL